MPPTRLTALAVAVLLAAGCSGGSKGASKDDAQTSSTAFAKPKVDLVVSRAELVSPHQALGPLDDKTSDAVVGVVEKLLLVTSAGPLADGKAGGALPICSRPMPAPAPPVPIAPPSSTRGFPPSAS